MSKKVISLFSGAGGMDLGFEKSGFNVVWANDFEIDAVRTYKKNINNNIILGDITQIDSSEIPIGKGEADVLIGGFPCQGFSVANTKRNMDDQRNFLYKEMLRIIANKRPKFIVAENVKGLLSMESGKVINMIVNDFKALGYDVDWRLLNSADYGVPQLRERVIIIGNRLGMKNPYPLMTHSGQEDQINMFDDYFNPYKTVHETIGFLKDIPIRNQYKIQDIVVDGRPIYNHIANTKVEDTFFGRKYDVNQEEICDYLKYWKNKSEWTVSKIDDYFGYAHTAGHWFRKDNNSGSIPKPNDWWKLKEILKFDDTYDEAVTVFIEKPIKFEQSLRITNWDRPSDTITATSPEIHINKDRRLSARECALIQTFPDEFKFEGSLSSMYRQIGNAVPPLLAEKIANGIYDALDRNGI